MRIDWSPLDRELALWADAGLVLPFWWRDDDAVAPGPALARLADLGHRLGVNLHLAVIPAGATSALAELVAADPRLIALVHGWAHTNHAPPDAKKAELGADRASSTVIAEVRSGLLHIRALFGPRSLPVLVPPWNRIAPEVAARLAAQGFAGLSAFGPRKAARPYPGLVQVNTHCDPIDWHGSRSLVPPEVLVPQIAATLADRRLGATDRDEPFGLLTHHLVHDDLIWRFCEDLVSRLLATVARPADISAIIIED